MPPKRKAATASGGEPSEKKLKAESASKLSPDRTEAERLVKAMTVEITGIPEPTTLLGIRNVTQGALVRFSGKAFGPVSKQLATIRPFEDLWQRYWDL